MNVIEIKYLTVLTDKVLSESWMLFDILSVNVFPRGNFGFGCFASE